MIAPKDKALLATTLLMLFGGGMATGFFLGKKSVPIAQAPPLAGEPSEKQAQAAGDWWQRALDRLVLDLALRPQQQATVEPLLQQAGTQIFHNRDRALFQIHLELLAFHEKLAAQPALLDPAQQERVGEMKTKLQRQIERQFPQFLKENPLPTTAQVSPAP